MQIRLFKPQISEEAVAAAAATLRSGWLGQGARVAAFEDAFARYIGAAHCVTVNSCTAALHLALEVSNLPEGTEVVTTPLTFVATHLAILHARCRPVLADIQPTTGNMDPKSLREKITGRTRAVLVVHYAGYPCDLDEICQVAGQFGLAVIEDCAHAAGAWYHGKKIGESTRLQCFSFGPTKSLTMGQGGAITTNASENIARLKRLRYLGLDRDTYERVQTATPDRPQWRYEMKETGFRYHLSDLNAAIGLAQLPLVDRQNQRRGEIAGAYRAGLCKVPGIELLRHEADRQSSHYMLPVLAERRDELVTKLARHKIETGVHYAPNGLFPEAAYRDLPHAMRFWERTITLPMHTSLTDDDVGKVIALVREGW